MIDAHIERCAQMLIDRYGADAVSHALARAHELQVRGEPDASETWMQVRAAIKRLQADKPGNRDEVA